MPRVPSPLDIVPLHCGVGMGVGKLVGPGVGTIVGPGVGADDGPGVGANDGLTVNDGAAVGAGVGASVAKQSEAILNYMLESMRKFMGIVIRAPQQIII